MKVSTRNFQCTYKSPPTSMGDSHNEFLYLERKFLYWKCIAFWVKEFVMHVYIHHLASITPIALCAVVIPVCCTMASYFVELLDGWWARQRASALLLAVPARCFTVNSNSWSERLHHVSWLLLSTKCLPSRYTLIEASQASLIARHSFAL